MITALGCRLDSQAPAHKKVVGFIQDCVNGFGGQWNSIRGDNGTTVKTSKPPAPRFSVNQAVERAQRLDGRCDTHHGHTIDKQQSKDAHFFVCADWQIGAGYCDLLIRFRTLSYESQNTTFMSEKQQMDVGNVVPYVVLRISTMSELFNHL